MGKKYFLCFFVIIGFFTGQAYADNSSIIAKKQEKRHIDFYIPLQTGGPFVYKENDVIKGAAIDIVTQLLKEMHVTDVKDHIHMIPSADAMKFIKGHSNVFLFPAIRLNYQKDLWFSSSLIQTDEVILGQASQGRLSTDELGNYTYALTTKNLAGYLLQQKGVPMQQLKMMPSDSVATKAFIDKKVDLLPGLDVSLWWNLKQNQAVLSNYQVLYELSEPFDLSVMSNASTSPDLQVLVQGAVTALRSRGYVDEIMQSYTS